MKEIQRHGVSFGSVAVGSTGTVVSLNFNFTAADNGISTSVLTQGATGLDFADAKSGSCDPLGASYTSSSGGSCTVDVIFSPKYAGARYGAVQLSDATGVIATAYIYGTGTGPQVAFAPPTLSTLGGGWKAGGVGGVAVDGAGNVYVADVGNSAVNEMPPGCASSSCVTTLGGGFSYPYGVAVDGSGNVYVADSNNNALKEMPPDCASSSCVTTLGGGYPFGVAVDGSGNVYLGGNGAVHELGLAAPPSFTFASANVGSQSSDSPQTVTLQNIGNAPLTFPVPGTGENPSISAGFTLDSSTTCPDVLTSSSPGTLAAGATCSLAVDFIPTLTGVISGGVVLTDNNLNATNATQQILLSGTGVGQTPTITWATPAAITYGTPLSSTQLDATASVGGTFVYSPPVGTPLNASMQTLSVTFTPNDTTDYTTANASVMLQVNMAPQTITFAAIPATQQGETLSLSATGGLSGNPVTFTSLTPGVCSVLNATATLSSPGTCTIQANQAGNANYAAAIPVSQSVINTAALSFGTVPVGTTSATQTITFSPPGGSSLASISVVTQGAANLDFANAGGGTCNPSLTRFASGTTCTVNVTFTPKYAGVRYGAVVLTDGSGNVFATSFVSGIGQGPQIVFQSNQAIQALGGGLSYPAGVAADGNGNIYVADAGYHAIREIPPGCASESCITTLGGGFFNSDNPYGPYGVAVDGGGNVYVADYSNKIVKEMPPGCASASCTTTLGGGFVGPYGLAVDGSGNVYVADQAEVKEMPSGCASSSCVSTLGGGFLQTYGITVDGSGNVYVADTSNKVVKKMPPGCASAGCVATLGGGFIDPIGVAVDGSGNLYVADEGANSIEAMPPDCASAGCITKLGGGFSLPLGVAVDGSGNVYVGNSINTGNIPIDKIDLVDPPALSFANANVGSKSSDSPQMVALRNIGNAPLTLAVPGTGENPSILANFALDSATTCPEVLTSSSAGTLAAGATCTLALDFIPTTAGSINGTAILTDNNLNAAPVMQTINLRGTGVIPTVNVSIGTNPAGLSFSINGTPYTTTQTPNLNIGTQYTLSTTSPLAGGPGVQYVFSQWSDGTMGLADQLTPTASTSSETAQFTAQYLLTVTAGSGGTIGAGTAPNAFYNPATVQPIAATPNTGYYFTGWTGANSPGDVASATSASTSVTMNGPENLTANFAPIPNLQVTTLNDDATGNASNCTPPSSGCTLRDAITAAEANNGAAGNITFASGMNGTITLTSALPALSGQITITGPGAANLSISGGNSQSVGSVFTVNPGATVAFSGVTITGGNSVNGGGITNNGTTTVTNSAISGNTGGCGGAICSLVGSLTLSDSTISGNHAQFNGGAIVNGSTLMVINSTIANNQASYDYGGGIFNNNGALTVLNSTVSGNVSGQFGGGIYNTGTVTVNNSIVVGNTANGNPGDDCDRCGTQSNYNLISTPTNIINPMLAPLGNYGGPTQTMLPLPGSAAICGASSALIPAGITTDQRGFPNSTTYNSTQCYDLGAVQTNYSLSFSATQEPPSTGTLPTLPMSPAPVVTVTESGNPLTAGSASVNLTDTNSDLTTSPATATTSASNGQATFGTLIFTGPTSGDTLAATLALNSNLAGLNLTATSINFSVAAGTPAVLWPTASAITFGQTLASSTLSGGSASFNNTSVTGSFAFTNPSTIPGAGVQTENVIFTPSNTSAYNSVNGTVSVPVNKAMPTVTFTGAPVTAPYGGTFAVTATTNASTTAVITASGSCSIAGAIVTITLPSGRCSLTAAWAADNNYLAASALQTTTATKATPMITWGAPAAITYGTALSGTQLDATATYNGATVGGKFVYTPAKGTVLTAGTQTLSVTFTPTNTTNFATPPSASVTLQVNQATPKITWAKPAAISYGTALSSTQLDATASVPGSFVYAPAAGTILEAGTQTLSVTFTPTDAVDYTTAGDSATLSVNKATPVVTWPTPAPIVYGAPLGSTQLDATASVPGTFAYSPAAGKIEPAGSDKLSVTFTPTDTVDYATVTASVTLQVGLATPTIIWAPPTAMTYGTALSTKQLNATATNNGVTVAGTFVYTPAKGTVLGAGSQTLSVKFTPTNTTDFTSASASVTLQVNPATPKITWAKPAAITYGTALSSNQLDATASVPGTLIYSPPAGTVISGGTQTLSVTFSPTNSVDYTSAADSVSIIVYQSTSTTTITANTPDPAAVDQPVSVGFTVDGANGIPTGTVSVTASTGQSCTGALSGGNGSCALTFTATGSPKLTAVYSGDNNFKTSTSAKVTETVN